MNTMQSASAGRDAAIPETAAPSGTGGASSRFYVESWAGIVALHLLRNRRAPGDAGAGKPPPRAVMKALVFMQGNYARAITVRDIAAAAHLSPFHFSRRFKRATGFTPHRYLIHVRVNAARCLLMSGRYRSLAEIAGAVGFADQSHLARHFKRAFGVAPGRVSRGPGGGEAAGRTGQRLLRAARE
ncbi:MAG TPA: AraC family transcriptional regulator [Burkholderiales bacterium]|jgi:AraC family transcriptional regulator|nr:AraC family transcriptional regulator [Burkholderiales bacterium]